MSHSAPATTPLSPQHPQMFRKVLAVCLLFAALAYGIFYGIRLRYAGGNPGALVNVGENYTYNNHNELAPTIPVNSPAGYDGQFFYRLAADPLTRTRVGHGIIFDAEAYRHQRIAYPLLVRAVALGQEPFLPWAMIIVNFVALLGLAYVGILYARAVKVAPYWGMLFGLCPSYVFTITRDLAEVVQAAFLLTAFYLLRRDRPLLATAALVVACFTRETALLAAVACAPTLLLSFRPLADNAFVRRFSLGSVPGLRWHFVVVPSALILVWQAILYAIWGKIPVRSNPNAFQPFFTGLQPFLAIIAKPGPFHRFWMLEVVFWGVFALLAVLALRRSQALLHEKLFFTIHLIMASAFSYDLWREDWGYMRLLIEFYVGGWLVLTSGSPRLRWIAAVVSVGMWLLTYWNLTSLPR